MKLMLIFNKTPTIKCMMKVAFNLNGTREWVEITVLCFIRVPKVEALDPYFEKEWLTVRTCSA